MRGLVLIIAVAALGCGDDLKKMCFEKLIYGACNELCDVKGNRAACGKSTQIRMDLCLIKGEQNHCEFMCEETGIAEFCAAAKGTKVVGSITKDAVMATEVKSGEEFDAAKERVVAALGKSVYHDTRLQWWGVLEGETCYGIGFQWKDDWVGEVVGPGPMEGDLFPHCKAAAQLNECAKTKPSSECRKQIELPDVWND